MPSIVSSRGAWARSHVIAKSSQCRELTELRAEFDWLAELPAQAAQQVFAELDLAFQRCWKGLGDDRYPWTKCASVSWTQPRHRRQGLGPGH